MTGATFEVPPLSRRDIRGKAAIFRRDLDLKRAYLDVLRLIEVPLADLITLEGCDHQEMGACHGLSYPDARRILIREDVYQGARNGLGRDRFTVAHELGHLVLHHNLGLARAMPSANQIQPFRSSEWQANCFAGELLVSHLHLKGCETPRDLEERFGVSGEAADLEFRKFKEEKLI